MRVGKGREGTEKRGGVVEGQASRGERGFFPITAPLLNNKLGV
jgi:hypothetical protein